MRRTQCSVLLCVYRGDVPDYLRVALKSITEQTWQPEEIIVVEDGPVGEKIEETLKEFKDKIKVVKLQKNMGVGHARNEGLKHCKNELVAVMDADDIAMPERLKLQITEFDKDKNLVLLGGQVAEFDSDPENIIGERIVPLEEKEIRKFAHKRSPFNNVTVMYKKSAVAEVGGYSELNRAEDYLLFAKLIAAKKKVKNLPQMLVKVRSDSNFIQRRKSWQHTREMISARNQIRKLGIINTWDLIETSAVQILFLITPNCFVKWFYKTWLRGFNG